MPQRTLLSIVQEIMNDMDSDNVNAVDDTVESDQVARIVKSTYEEILEREDWPHLRTLENLTASGTSARPSHMIIPDAVKKIQLIKYDCQATGATRTDWRDMDYKDPVDFLSTVMRRDNSATNVDTVTDLSGVTVYIINDRAPSYWTSFDDENIIFDSYDSAVESTLQSAKSQALVYKEPTELTIADGSIPDLPSKVFPLLIAEAKANCFEKIKQMRSATTEQTARRQRGEMARDKWRTNGGIKVPDYGRRSKK
jgi:hypothetical protein